MFGVEVPGTDGRAGMAAVKLREGSTFNGKALAGKLFERLPGYAVPLFIRIVASLETTSTFKSRKVDLRDAGLRIAMSATRCTSWPAAARATCRSTTTSRPRCAAGKRPTSLTPTTLVGCDDDVLWTPGRR